MLRGGSRGGWGKDGSSRGRSPGRGRGGSFGIGGFRHGPSLPFALMRELGGDGDAGGGGGGGRGQFGAGGGRGGPGGRGRGLGRGGRGGQGGSGDPSDRGVKRRADALSEGPSSGGRGGSGAARQDRDAARPAKRPAISQAGGQGEGKGAKGSSGNGSGGSAGAGGLTRTLAAMRQRQSGGGPAGGPGGEKASGYGSHSGSRRSAASGAPGVSSKTKFHELLVDGWESRNGREAFLEELRLQARLAKRLGKSKKDALDGMDRLLGYLSAGSETLLPKFLDPNDRQEAAELLKKAGSGSGSGSKQQQQQEVLAETSAQAAARRVAELLDRESDEELEFFGIDPANKDREVELDEEDEDIYGGGGFGSGSDESGSDEGDEDEDAEGEDEYDSEEEDDGLAGFADFGSGSEGSLEGEDDEGEDGESEMETDEEEGDMEGDGEGKEEEDEEPAGVGTLQGGRAAAARGSKEPRLRAGSLAGPSDGSDSDGSGSDGGEDENGRDSEAGLSASDDSDDSADDEDEDSDAEENSQDDEDGSQSEGLEEEAGPSGQGAAALAAVGAAGAQRYIPPALRAQMAAAGGAGGADPARAQVERRVTGLVNRLAAANLQPISRDVADLYRTQGRRMVSEAVAAQILGAAESGPRASEQFAAVAAAFVAAVAALAEAQDLAAGFMAALAERLEAARGSGDSLAQSNLVTLLSYCYSAGLVGPGLCYSLLEALKERFLEADVSAMVTLLNAVGLQLRNADPALMKEFVLGVHEKAAQMGRDGQISRRALLMLDLIIDIKNNKTSTAGAAAASVSVSLGGTAVGKKGKAAAAAAATAGASGGGRRGGALAVLQPSVAKWLQQIGVDEVCLRGITWQKLLAPNKKGMWWQPVAGEALDDPLMLTAAGGGSGGGATTSGAAAAAAAAADAGGNAASTAKLMQLAAAQRMNTDARRAVFVAIMGSEDCAEAHEKLLRLPLKGDQRREILRVLVDCCLAEKVWNPYYAFLALRLCGGGGGDGGGSLGRAHRVTAQYCLWDKLKEVESMDVRQLSHLAKLMAILVARFALSLSFLKVVDWSDLSTKEALVWRVFLQHLLSSCKTSGDVKEIFKRVASQPKSLSALISGLLLFLRSSFAPWVASKLDPGPESDELLRRTRAAEKELAAGAATAAAVTF